MICAIIGPNGAAKTTLFKTIAGRVGLTGAADTSVASFSLGMKQRLALARAIGHRPELVVLDEPANGLDPTGIADLRDVLVSLSQQGTTFVSPAPASAWASPPWTRSRTARMDRSR